MSKATSMQSSDQSSEHVSANMANKPQPGPLAVAPGRMPGATTLAVLASAVLLWASFFPLAWGFLGWVALVPLLALLRMPLKAKRFFFASYAAGLLFYLPVLQWMRVADPMMYICWGMLAFYCALYYPVGLWLVRRLDRKTALPLIVSLPVVWVGLEYLRSFLMTGFAWYFLGHTQHDYLPLIQMADVGGVYLVSFLVVAVNAWLFELLWSMPNIRTWLGVPAQPLQGYSTVETRVCTPRGLVMQAAVLVVLFSGALSYGYYRMGQEAFARGPIVALVQSNVPQSIRNEVDSATDTSPHMQILKHNTSLSDIAMHQFPGPDLLVWPETSYPFYWDEFPTDLNDIPKSELAYAELLQENIKGLGKRFKTSMLLGMNSFIWHDGDNHDCYNSAILFNDQGHLLGKYDKIHRVPFGEYAPLVKTFPFMRKLVPHAGEGILAGKALTPMKLGQHRFGVLICYEDTDPVLARGYAEANRHAKKKSDDSPARPGANPGSKIAGENTGDEKVAGENGTGEAVAGKAVAGEAVAGEAAEGIDFLINMSNDGWFHGTSEHEQHLALCRFRAIESRLAIARSVNMGVSAVIDGSGRVQKPQRMPQFPKTHFWQVNEDKFGVIPELPVSEWHDYKKVDGVLTAIIPIDNRVSLYARWGDWFALLCWAVAVAGLVWGWRVARPGKSLQPMT